MNADTRTALKAIRAALRTSGVKAEAHTRLGTIPTTKRAILDLLPTLGEVTYTSARGGSWTFTDDNEEYDTRVSTNCGTVSIDCGGW